MRFFRGITERRFDRPAWSSDLMQRFKRLRSAVITALPPPLLLAPTSSRGVCATPPPLLLPLLLVSSSAAFDSTCSKRRFLSTLSYVCPEPAVVNRSVFQKMAPKKGGRVFFFSAPCLRSHHHQGVPRASTIYKNEKTPLCFLSAFPIFVPSLSW